MTDAVRISLADLLPSQLDGLGRVVKASLGKSGRIPGWSLIQERFEAGLRDELAKIDLLELLGQAWTCARELHSHRNDDAQTHAVVPFGENRIALQAAPVVSLWIAGWECPPIKLDYALEAAFATVSLATCGGKLVSAEPGECKISASLRCEGVSLHDPRTLNRFRLPGIIRFSPGLPIV